MYTLIGEKRKMTPGGNIDLMKSELRQLIKKRAFLTSEQFGRRFKLASGEWSDVYFDCKMVTQDPKALYLISKIIFEMIRNENVNCIGGMGSGAIPIATAVSMLSYQEGKPIPAFWVRRKAKAHGTMNKVEGYLKKNSNVVIVDDVTTKGGSVLRAINVAKREGCQILKVITLLDRQEGAEERLKAKGMELIPIFRKQDIK